MVEVVTATPEELWQGRREAIEVLSAVIHGHGHQVTVDIIDNVEDRYAFTMGLVEFAICARLEDAEEGLIEDAWPEIVAGWWDFLDNLDEVL